MYRLINLGFEKGWNKTLICDIHVFVISDKGVMENFTIFTGDDLIEKTKTYLENNHFGFPRSTEPLTVEGYLTGMLIGKFSHFFENLGT